MTKLKNFHLNNSGQEREIFDDKYGGGTEFLCHMPGGHLHQLHEWWLLTQVLFPVLLQVDQKQTSVRL